MIERILISENALKFSPTYFLFEQQMLANQCSNNGENTNEVDVLKKEYKSKVVKIKTFLAFFIYNFIVFFRRENNEYNIARIRDARQHHAKKSPMLV